MTPRFAVLFLPALFLAATGLQAQTDSPSPLPVDPLDPDVVLEIPGGPRLIHFESPGTSVASLRLSVPIAERPAEAGGGRLLLAAALERVEPLAERVGARVEGVRTFHGLAYTVSGPSSAFDHLAWLLRELVRAPDEAGVGSAIGELRTTLEGGRETPAGVLETRLREGLTPGLPPLSGTLGSLNGMTPRALRDLWERSHRREAMTLVVAAPVPVEVLLAGVLDTGVVGENGPDPAPAPAPREPERARTQVLRSWYGEAYPVDLPDDPRSAVAARLMAETLQSLPGRVEAGVQLWEMGGRAALVVTGVAYPNDAAAMRSRIQRIRDDVLAAADPASVERIVADLRGEALLAARSNGGLVGVVGYHLDATGNPASARSFLDALSQVDAAAMTTFLGELRERTAVTADVRP